MSQHDSYKGGENFDLRQILLRGRAMRLRERTAFLGDFLRSLDEKGELLCRRVIVSPSDREVLVHDPLTQCVRPMLMFGSNNYLGLASHPAVQEKACEGLKRHGAGIGGPPLLNGYTTLHRELEERLAAFKGTEDALIFSSGYGANVGLLGALLNADDAIVYDAYSHASFIDGMRLAGVSGYKFPHNSVRHLQQLLESFEGSATRDLFVGVEGVYSMDGDCAPLDAIVPLCSKHGALLVLDDAHGTGVMGTTGRGTAEAFGLEGKIDITMGTFSKAFAVTGGFVAASKPVVDYLRYIARSYMFSASLPPVILATVLAGMDVIDEEPELLHRLRSNILYCAEGLRTLGFSVGTQTPIMPLRVPPWMDIRRAAIEFHRRGIFVNSIEYPAVPVSQQRFRVSLMATHTTADFDRLFGVIDEVWHLDALRSHAETVAGTQVTIPQ